MTTLFLVRHGAHDRLGKVLCGRMPGVTLSETGQAEARRLAQRFALEDLRAVVSSPLKRARQTAEPVAAAAGLSVEIDDELTELDFGDWTGMEFAALDQQAEWARWNRIRLQARPPHGESFVECQARIARVLERLCRRYADARVVVVCHADCIKAALAHFIGLPLDFHDRFEIGPGSTSVVSVGDWGAKVMSVNEAIPG